MNRTTAAAPAQDNTAPAAAAPAAPAASVPAAPVSAPAAPADPQPTTPTSAPATEPQPAPAGKEDPETQDAADGVEFLLGDDGADSREEGETAVPADGEGYELTFPDNMVADDEAVAVLNEVGKEFGVSGEAAQKLADAATAYANRRVDAVLEAGKKGYADFCAEEARKTKQYYGAEYKTRLAEAVTGLNKLLPEGVTVDAIRNDHNFQALTNVWWFAEMGRTFNQLTAEQPSITGEAERPKAQDLYSKYDG